MMMQCHKIGGQGVIAHNANAAAQLTAELIVKAFSCILARKEKVLFIPSSGNTPVKTYKLLAAKYKTAIDWSRVTLIQMDEYAAPNLDEEFYFQAFLQKNLVAPLAIGTFISMHKEDGQGLFSPDHYAQKLAVLGPVDFALHGIGRNGHIGFNEPGSETDSLTRIVSLAPETRGDNFPNMPAASRPKYGMTLGLKDLKNVQHTLLIATGAHKSTAVQNLLNKASPLDTPACILWDSPDFGIITDREAAGLQYMPLDNYSPRNMRASAMSARGTVGSYDFSLKGARAER